MADPTVDPARFHDALAAALLGPARSDISWTSASHDFNVKPALISVDERSITFDGRQGHQLSHRRSWRGDEQCVYRIQVSAGGSTSVGIRRRRVRSSLTAWVRQPGQLAESVAWVRGQKLDSLTGIGGPVPSTLDVLDGSWQGDAAFLLANLVSYGVAQRFPGFAP